MAGETAGEHFDDNLLSSRPFPAPPIDEIHGKPEVKQTHHPTKTVREQDPKIANLCIFCQMSVYQSQIATVHVRNKNINKTLSQTEMGCIKLQLWGKMK